LLLTVVESVFSTLTFCIDLLGFSAILGFKLTVGKVEYVSKVFDAMVGESAGNILAFVFILGFLVSLSFMLTVGKADAVSIGSDVVVGATKRSDCNALTLSEVLGLKLIVGDTVCVIVIILGRGDTVGAGVVCFLSLLADAMIDLGEVNNFVATSKKLVDG
jgi:hypothetical protein